MVSAIKRRRTDRDRGGVDDRALNSVLVTSPDCFHVAVYVNVSVDVASAADTRPRSQQPTCRRGATALSGGITTRSAASSSAGSAPRGRRRHHSNNRTLHGAPPHKASEGK